MKNKEAMSKQAHLEQTVRDLENNIRDLELRNETIRAVKEEREKYLLEFEERLV